MLDIGERLSQYEPLWETWYKDHYIDSGSFARVYAFRQELYGDVRYSAVKIVPMILKNSSAAARLGYSAALEEKRSQVAQEIQNMHRLEKKPYLVHCLNHAFKDIVDENGETVGFDLLIQMELLTPLASYMKEHGGLSEPKIQKFARQIGAALKAMHDINMLHRDIKVQNVYIDDAGDFLLGDFGVSKQMASDSFQSLAGTEPFIAPEVWNVQHTGKNYTKTADIYSYGITLYYLLNGNMLPFVSETSTQNDIDYAITRRLAGEEFPPPRNGSEKLKSIVMKCCKYDPADRYRSMDDILRELLDTSDDSALYDSVPFKAKETPDEDETKFADEDVPHGSAEYADTYETSYADTSDGKSSQGVSRVISSVPSIQPVSEQKNAPQNLFNKAEEDDGAAQNSLGDSYFYGNGVAQSYEKAFYWYNEAAKKGNLAAQNNLGYCYAYGKGAQADAAKAVYWYAKAAEAGHNSAQFNLGLCFESGRGTEKDPEKAAYWYSEAANRGNEKAQYYLGRCFEDGKGVSRDLSKALYWYSESAKAGNEKAKLKLKELNNV